MESSTTTNISGDSPSSPRCVISLSTGLACSPPGPGSSPPPPESSPTSVVLQVLFVLFMAGTVVGNALVIAAVSLFGHLRTRTNAFTLSLAAVDALIALVVMPFSSTRTVRGGCWAYGGLFCKLHHALDYSLCTSSIVHLSCIAFDRYTAICHPLRYQALVNRRSVAAMLTFAWLGPTFYVVPFLLHWNTVGIEAMVVARTCPGDCVLYKNVGFVFLDTTCAFFVPMGIMIVAYAKIYRVARRQARQIHASRAQSQENDDESRNRWRRMRREHGATKTLATIMGVFLLCWLPIFLLSVVDPLIGYSSGGLAWNVVTWLGYVNSGINPLLYASLNRPFRRAFGVLIRCGCRRVGRAGDDDAEAS